MFDLIIANPPYKAGLHLKFLEKSLDLINENGEIIFVHPAEWLVQKRITSKSKKYFALKEKLDKLQVSITFIDNIFKDNANLVVPLCITYIKNKKGKLYFEDKRTYEHASRISLPQKEKKNINSLNDVTNIGDAIISNNIKEKVFIKLDNNWKNKEYKINGNFYVNLPSICVGSSTTKLIYLDGVEREIPNSYSFLNKLCLEITTVPGVNTKGKERHWFSFKTKEEAQNALDFLSKTVFFRAYLSIVKIDQSAANNILPWIPWLDWTQQWTDEKLFKYFNLTEEEIEEIYNIIKIITINDKK